jgi:lipoic acid synthetase
MSSALKLPQWFKQSGGKLKATRKLSDMLEDKVPNSICQEARCPNRSECFAKGILTFMILGTTCTRNCGFCSVAHGVPLPPDPKEAQQIVSAIESLSLKFIVLTSPNRDDLPDNGAGHYAHIISTVRKAHPHVKIEVLIPDFQGKEKDIQVVIDANPDVINHNLETVPHLYDTVRRGSDYSRSLSVLNFVKTQAPHILTKTGVMVGLGETLESLESTFKDIQKHNVDILTLGQYLKPDKNNLDVQKYYHPDEFDALKEIALQLGIRHVFAGPLVRSSFLAEHVFEDTLQTYHSQ